MKTNALTFADLDEIMDFIPKTDKVVSQIHTAIDYAEKRIFYIEFMGNGSYATFHYRESTETMKDKILNWLKG